MVSFYDDMAGIASELINEFQQGQVYYVALVPGSGPEHDPGEPTEVETLVPAVARGVQFKYIDGTNIVASDGQITIPADTGIVPSIDGYVRVDDRKHRIISCTAIPPAGTAVAYRVIYKR